jgi:hypothetical protein
VLALLLNRSIRVQVDAGHLSSFRVFFLHHPGQARGNPPLAAVTAVSSLSRAARNRPVRTESPLFFGLNDGNHGQELAAEMACKLPPSASRAEKPEHAGVAGCNRSAGLAGTSPLPSAVCLLSQFRWRPRTWTLVFQIGLIWGLAAVYILSTVIGMVRQVEGPRAGSDLQLLCSRMARSDTLLVRS